MGNKKKKQKQRTKRQQRKAQKRREREKRIKASDSQKPNPSEPMPGYRNFRQSDELVRWLSHGANFFSSDYESGSWSPIFPDLYGDRPVIHAKTQKDLLRLLRPFYWNEETSRWKPEGETVVAWCMVPPETAYAFYLKSIELLMKADVEDPFETIWEPYNGIVWEFLHEMEQKLAED
jgi:hypothetical protein